MEWILVYGLVFGRLAAFVAMLPLFGGDDIMPPHVQGTLFLVLLPFMIPLEVAMSTPLSLDVTYVMLLGKEVLLGLFIGFLVGLPLRLPEMIGDLIDLQRGAAVTDAYNPLSGHESSQLGQLLMFTVFAYFLNEGGLTALVRIISGSFAIQGPATYGFNFGDDFLTVAMVFFTEYLKLFAILALPVIVSMFMVDIALGLASRSAQSLNAFQLAQPIKAVVAISVCLLLQPYFVRALMGWMDQIGTTFGA